PNSHLTPETASGRATATASLPILGAQSRQRIGLMLRVGFHGNGVARHWETVRSASSLRARTPRPSQRRLPRMLEGVRPRAPAIDVTETLSSHSAISRRTSSTDHGLAE